METKETQVERKFKVGDRVRWSARAIAEGLRAEKGSSGPFTVLAVDSIPSAQLQGVASCGDLNGWFHFNWLELVPPALIDPAKTYTTRDGRAVRIYATDGGGTSPVHGATQEGEYWRVKDWTATGLFFVAGGPDDLDLIEVKPEFETWLVLRRCNEFNYFMSYREKPSSSECPNAVAMKRVTLTEGEGM